MVMESQFPYEMPDLPDCNSQCRTSESPDPERSRQGADVCGIVPRKPAPFDASQARVAILLCTCNGQRYLAEQLDSIAVQSHANWQVHVSDDGSRDDTMAMLEKYREHWGSDRLFIYAGPTRGLVANFLSLTCNAAIQADYFAYADQDDIWATDKLQRAVTWLKGVAANIPALYCSRTQLVDENGKHLGYSPLCKKPPAFTNALVQNIAGGNTMVFNVAAHALLRESGEKVDVVMHDWWTYLVISGCGGQVHYDARPSLGYRQHGGNQVGSGAGWVSRGQRIGLLFKGSQQSWNDRNIQALQHLKYRLTPANRKVFEEFSTARNRWLPARIRGVWCSGVYKQSSMATLGLLVAVIFKRI